MGVIINASIFIEAESDRFDLGAMLESLGDELVAIAAITASELLHGVERAKTQTVRSARHRFVEGIIADIPVLPFGMEEAREHSRLWASLAAAGKSIGPHDLLVAATAIANASAVATLNQKEFKRVPGLTVMPTARFAKQLRRQGRG